MAESVRPPSFGSRCAHCGTYLETAFQTEQGKEILVVQPCPRCWEFARSAGREGAVEAIRRRIEEAGEKLLEGTDREDTRVEG